MPHLRARASTRATTLITSGYYPAGRIAAVALYDLKAAPPPPKSGDHTGRFLSRTQAREEELAQIEAS
eukprot:CAMPEP_0182512664 /NCGR_PEP_ID=MMETSP1321-20130603/32547_1 /TAXON_ID=91990 /ORGANISM="Bolidomonas sp., Strain RCC1657" /LENGTH=67 /DNA_ID=CAMNT_0024719533 /DNA_START=107 /DNA_END=305 /DNA_ORIENTATION=-